MIGIGIDTGGTYTDAVIYDFEKEQILGSGKSPTTHQKLEIGIEDALDALPEDLLKQGEFLALSTTLATNACVEGTGGRAKLVFFGVEYKIVEEMYQKYGLPQPSEILFLDGKDNSWEDILLQEIPELENYDSIALVQIFASKDGGKLEKRAKDLLKDKLNMPIVCGYELFQERNVLRRGAGAILNAQLIPVIHNFIDEVKLVLNKKGLNIPIVIVRSDGSMMSLDFALEHPVETLLCGPAASVMAGAKLSSEANALIVDMGGTTTDIAIIEDGVPVLEKSGICIGKWKTFVKGLYVDTFGLGGDTVVRYENGALFLDKKRVVPLCVLASEYPEIKDELREMIAFEQGLSIHFQHEFYLLVHDITDKSGFTEDEKRFCEALKQGPLILKKAAAAVGRDTYNLRMERLEKSGVVIRAGLTPTDIMHIKGDFQTFDAEASQLAVSYVASCVHMDENVLANKIYDLVEEKLYCNLVRILWHKEMPDSLKYNDSRKWDEAVLASYYMVRENKNGMCNLSFKTKATLVGIGAPIHIFLESVAKLLGTKAIVPQEAPAANALGAVLGNVTASYTIELVANFDGGQAESYSISGDETSHFETYEEAQVAAEQAARQMAAKRIEQRGATEYTISITTKKVAPVVEGNEMFFSESVTAKAIGKISFWEK